MKSTLLTLALMAAFFSAHANANITVEPMSSVISVANDGVGQLRIASKSKAIQYLRLTVKRVEAPATPQERDVDTNPADGSGLIASPQRIVLPGGAKRVVRLAVLETPKVETLYRVFVEPVAAPADKGDAVAVQGASGVTSKVSVTLVWGALVRVEPEAPAPSLALDASHERIVNAGNVRVPIARVGRCGSAKGSDCQWFDIGTSVYPGQTMDLPKMQGEGRFIRVKCKLDGKTESEVDLSK